MKRRVFNFAAIGLALILSGCGSNDDGQHPATEVSPPSITAHPQPQAVVAGSVVTFTVGASGTPPLAYQWKHNGSDIAGANGASLTVLSVAPTHAGVFSVVVTNAAGTVTTHEAALTVTAPPPDPLPAPVPPAITAQPQSHSVPAGSAVTFTVGASGSGPLAFQWRRGGAAIPGADAASLTLLSVEPADSGIFSVVVSNAAGSVTSSEVMLEVSAPLPPPPSAPVITHPPQSQSAAAGEAVTFSVEAGGSTPLAFQWQRDGTAIPGATDRSLTLLSLEPADSGTFAVVVSNAAGTVTSAAATLSVTSAPPPPPPGGGLTAEYYDAPAFGGTPITRTDATIDFAWGAGAPDPAMGADMFSVRWIGYVEPRYSETYTFYAVADDGVRLSVHNQVLVDAWFDQPATEWSGSITLSAGQRYEIVLAYYDNTGSARMQLYWSSASQPKEIIPATQLYPLGDRAAGGITREYWLGIPGKGVSDLTDPARNSNYPHAPSGSDLLALLEGPTDWADNYGTRIRGFVHAPMTGYYEFWLAADDTSELYLSGDENPATKRLIAHQASFATAREWNKYASQRSPPIFLEADRRYYIEVLQKEGTGGDNVAVGWRLPDGFLERPIPGHRLSPWP